MNRVKKLLILATFAAIAFALSACSSSAEKSASKSDAGKSKNESTMDNSKAAGDELKGSAIAETERKIIYQASIEAEVKDFVRSQAIIENELHAIKGYIITKEVYKTENNNKEGTFQLRVPQPSFQNFLHRLSDLKDIKITNQSVQGNDVTEEYVDLASRLKAKEAVESRLYDFMKRAQKTDDLLQVSRDLGTVQEEIENIKGKMQYLNKNSEMSSVTLHVKENKVIIPNIDSKELNTWERSKQSFVQTLQGLITVVSGIAVFLIGGSPVLLPLLAIAYGVWYWYRKKKNHQ